MKNNFQFIRAKKYFIKILYKRVFDVIAEII